MDRKFIGSYLLILLFLFSLSFILPRSVFAAARKFDLSFSNIDTCYNSCRYDPISKCNICDLRIRYQIVNKGPSDYYNWPSPGYVDWLSFSYKPYTSDGTYYGLNRPLPPISLNGVINNSMTNSAYVCPGVTYYGFLSFSGYSGVDVNPVNNQTFIKTYIPACANSIKK